MALVDVTWEIYAAAEDGVDGYSSVSAWEAATHGDLVAADERHIGEMWNENFAEQLDLDGSTTDATRYRWLRAKSGADFNHVTALAAGADPGARMVVTASANTDILYVQEAYSRVGGSEGANSGSVGFKLQSSGASVQVLWTDTVAAVMLSQVVIFESSASVGTITGIIQNSTAGLLYNCLAVDISAAAASKDARGFAVTADASTAYNCVAYNINADDPADDAYGFMGAITCRNCYGGGISATGGDEAFAFDDAAVVDNYCAADDTTPDGAQSHDSLAGGDCFVSVTGGSEDFHLKASSSLEGKGATAGTNGYDIDGSVAGDRLDIGIHEYVAPAAGGKPTMRYWGGVPGMVGGTGRVNW